MQWLREGQRYSACLDCCHQTLEKVLKAAIVERKNAVPPKAHPLDQLADHAGMDLPEGWQAELAAIPRHFWRVRNPDFHQAVYTSRAKVPPTLERTEKMYVWIKRRLSPAS